MNAINAYKEELTSISIVVISFILAFSSYVALN